MGHVLFHDDSPSTVATRMHDGVYVGSLYFLDPDGILLEFAAWTRELTPAEIPVNTVAATRVVRPDGREGDGRARATFDGNAEW